MMGEVASAPSNISEPNNVKSNFFTVENSFARKSNRGTVAAFDSYSGVMRKLSRVPESERFS